LAGLENIMVNQKREEIRDADNIIKNAKEKPRFPRPRLSHNLARNSNILILKLRRVLNRHFNYGR
jgi:hypothetical protein